MFEVYWNPSASNAERVAPAEGAAEPGWSPAVDLSETADAYLVAADVPGVEPSAIELSVTGNVLTLRGVKVLGPAAEPDAPRGERPFGPFCRLVNLPGEVDFDASTAEVRLGVLEIRLPKKGPTTSRTIPVRVR